MCSYQKTNFKNIEETPITDCAYNWNFEGEDL